MMSVFIGIDVGTGSARAGVFNERGTLLGIATKAIQMWKPQAEFVEQSSDDIWRACCNVVNSAVKEAGIKGDQVKGIGFDATCSLISLDEQGEPVTVSPTGRDEQNVIVWMDHRALEQTQRINATNHDVLKYVGGVISPEMQSPKLLWLKENLPNSWKRAAKCFDLPDFLTFKATGSDTRSLCSTVCKWTYLGHEKDGDSPGKWDDSFWRAIGLEQLADEEYARIGKLIRPMGEAIGQGLTQQSARKMGLNAGTPVGVSIIDAHAGGIGVIGATINDSAPTQEDM